MRDPARMFRLGGATHASPGITLGVLISTFLGRSGEGISGQS